MEVQEEDIVEDSTIMAFLDEPAKTGSIPNKIHSTEGARHFGYKSALVPGSTVYSWACSSIMKVLGEEWLENGWADIAFRRPIYPGQLIRIQITKCKSKEKYSFELRMKNEENQLCLFGNIGLGRAPWLQELIIPKLVAQQEKNHSKYRLTMENAPVGKDIPPRSVLLSKEKAVHYSLSFPKDDRTIFTKGPNPRVHPGWIAGQMNQLIEHSMAHLPAIHTSSKVQHLAKISSGQKLITFGHMTKVFEKKKNHYAVIDGLILDENGTHLAQLQHTTIFQIRSAM